MKLHPGLTLFLWTCLEAGWRPELYVFSGSLLLAKGILNGWISKLRPLKEMPLYKRPLKEMPLYKRPLKEMPLYNFQAVLCWPKLF